MKKVPGTLYLRPARRKSEVIIFDKVDPKSPISKKLKALGLKFSPNGMTFKKDEDKTEIQIYVPLKHDDLFIELGSDSFKTEKNLFKAAGEVRMFMMSRFRIPDTDELRNIIKINGGNPDTIIESKKIRPGERLPDEPKPKMRELTIKEENSFLGSLWNKIRSL